MLVTTKKERPELFFRTAKVQPFFV